MNPEPTIITTVTTYVESWTNTPIACAMFFALAGSVFVSIYYLRRRRGTTEAASDPGAPIR